MPQEFNGDIWTKIDKNNGTKRKATAKKIFMPFSPFHLNFSKYFGKNQFWISCHRIWSTIKKKLKQLSPRIVEQIFFNLVQQEKLKIGEPKNGSKQTNKPIFAFTTTSKRTPDWKKFWPPTGPVVGLQNGFHSSILGNSNTWMDKNSSNEFSQNI